MSRLTKQMTVTVAGLRGPGLTTEDIADLQGYTDEAQAARVEARAWADSDTPPDPTDPASKSAKTYRDEAAEQAELAEAAAEAGASNAQALATAFRESGTIGRPIGSNPITGNSFNASRIVINESATEDRVVETVDVYIASGAPRTITLKRAQLSKSEFGFPGTGDVTITIAANGYNAGIVVPGGGFVWPKGDFLAIETTASGALLRTTNPADGNGYFIAAGAPTAIALSALQTATRLEIRLNWRAQIVSADQFREQTARLDANESAITEGARRNLRKRDYIGSGPILPLLVAGRGSSPGSVLLGFDTSKQVLVGPGLGGSTSAAPVEYEYLNEGEAPVRTAWNGMVVSGESLSIGTGSQPALTTQPVYSAVTFGSGVKSGRAGSASGATLTNPGVSTSRALYEDNLDPMGATTAGETIISRAVKVATELAAEKQGIPPSANIIAASTAGKGSQQMGMIRKGQPWYNQFKDQVEGFKDLAPSGQFALHAVPLIIGQNDSANRSRTAFRDQILGYSAEINSDVPTWTGQTTPVHILAYQTPTTITGGVNLPENKGGVVLGWYDAINASPRIHFVTPYYFMAFSDGIHINNVSEQLAGAYFGRAYYQLVYEGRVPDCIWPLAAVARGTSLRVKFRVPPGKSLVIDGQTIGQATNNGFRVKDDTGDLQIGDMYVDGSDTLVLPLDRALGVNPVVRAGLDFNGAGLTNANGASTNLRDNTDDITIINGVTRMLYHWCPHFEMPISALEASR